MSTTPEPLSVLWRPPALACVLLVGEALALIMSLVPANDQGQWIAFGLYSLMIQWIAVGTLCSLYLTRSLLVRLHPYRQAWAGLGLLLLNAGVVAASAWGLLAAQMEMQQTRMGFVWRILAIALIVGLLGLVAYQNYWQARQLVIRTKQLELETLQARIRPHFLFNTLNTCIALVHAKPDAAERVLLDLADLFRSTLRGVHNISLTEELALTRRYLEIETLRFGDRLHIKWNVPEVIPAVLVPSLSIQPLVENAIRHGIEHRAAGGLLDVSVQAGARGIEIIVANDLADEEGQKVEGHAVGLASARKRVLALTHGQGQVEAGIQGTRYIARMTLPLMSTAPHVQPTTS